MSTEEKSKESHPDGSSQSGASPQSGGVPAEPETRSWKMIAVMGGVGLFSGVLIVFSYQLTLPYIKINKARYLEKSIFQVIPGATKKSVYRKTAAGTLEHLEGEDEKAFKVYSGFNGDGRLVGVAVEAKGQGFADTLVLIFGYDPERQCVVGIKVLESRETPGLGDKIEKDPDFLANFKCLKAVLKEDGQTLEHPPELVKKGQKKNPWEVEAITGATISSRAVTNILRKSTANVVPLIHKNLNTLRGKH